MTPNFQKTACRALVISVLALSFQTAHAGLISADQAAAGSVQTERAALLATLDRGDVTAQLQAAGVDPRAARDRVATMSDQEVLALSQNMQTAPAGALTGLGWLGVVLVAGLIWYYAMRK